MSRKARFSPQEKEQACIDYIERNRSRSEICSELHISTRTIQDWSAIYNKYGVAGFAKKPQNRSYSKQFKIEIVEKYIRGEASSIELGNQYDISSSLLRSWIRMYNANIELKDYNPKQEVYMAEARRKTTKEEREKIVEYCLNNNRDYKNTAVKFDVSYSQVYNWVRKYDACGLEGLTDKRGHHKTDDEVDELERLRRENLRLKHQLEEKDMVVELLNKVAKAEAAAERARQQVLNATKEIEKNQKKKVFASDKLKDAEFLGQDSTLLLVEGLSAASSVAMARDEKRYGILALRGKPINAFSNNEDKVYANEEMKLLLSAMNIIPGKYNSSKLRYGKIGILSDADADGYSIGLLIMCALYKFAPQFIEEGRLYWMRSPLYIVKTKGKEYYYYTDEEYTRRTVNGETVRAKGLGALSAEQAHQSMFTEEFQRMEQLLPDENTLGLLMDLMGKDSEPKKQFVFSKVDFTEIRE